MKKIIIHPYAALFLVLAVVVAWANPAYGGEDPVGKPGKRLSLPVLNAGCEPEAGPVKALPLERIQRNPLQDKLHAARRAGDEKRVRRLEAGLRRNRAKKEAMVKATRRPSRTFSGAGALRLRSVGNRKAPPVPDEQNLAFGDDVHVRSTSLETGEWNQTMVSDSQGNLYVAWQDDFHDRDYIQVYRSENRGRSWLPFGYVANTYADLKEPCLAVGEGAEDTLLLAYIRAETKEVPVPEVAVTDLSPSAFTVYSVPVWDTWEGYAKPVIWTDSHDYSGWYAYLTCEGIFDSASSNVNVCFWRSTDYGLTWGNEEVVLGDTDSYSWIDPDATYGTTLNRLLLCCYRDDNDTLYSVSSDDYGVTWNTPVDIYTLSSDPVHPVDPEIAAAVDHDHVMLCCTRPYFGNDSIGQTYSVDAGENWTLLYNLNGSTTDHEFGAALTANEGGGSWHLAFTSECHVFYSRRPQDLSQYWQAEPEVVDDVGRASNVDYRKGIASIWDMDLCGIAWTDWRDDCTDLDTYFDSVGNDDVLHVPSEYPTIQAAIDTAWTGCIVWVEPGTYEETIDFLGKAVTVQSAEGAEHTVIRGQQNGAVATFDSGEGPDSVLSGFMLTNGGITYGGIRCVDSSPVIRNNIITRNRASYGGGMYIKNSDAVIVNNLISRNTAEHTGGGICCLGGSPTLTNNTIVKNHGFNGGGIICYDGCSPVATNCILWDNSAYLGNEIYIANSYVYLTIRHSDVEGGQAGVGGYTGSQLNWGEGMVNGNPLFADPWHDDFRLCRGSACMDAGDNDAPCLPTTDLNGEARIQSGSTVGLHLAGSPPQSGVVDMGAHEYRLLWRRGALSK